MKFVKPLLQNEEKTPVPALVIPENFIPYMPNDSPPTNAKGGTKKKTTRTTQKKGSTHLTKTKLSGPKTGGQRRGDKPKVEYAPSKIYILELAGGYVYVGKSRNVKRRYEEHMRGVGACFTKYKKPTGKMLERLGNLEGDGDGPERDETLRQMDCLGFEKVRGWKYTSRFLSTEDAAEIESNIRELKDLCRRCGRSTHFARDCRCVTDRHGKKILDGKDQV